MKIELNSIYLYPLNSEELSLLLNDLPELEKKICCKYCAESISGIFKDIIQSQLILGLTDLEDNWKWHTCWFIIRKQDKKVIGLIFFKGNPDLNGEIEIGYGLGKDFEHNGYMTEAVNAICDWAFKQRGVNKIKAETKPDNYKSEKLLKRCDFIIYEETEFSIVLLRYKTKIK